MILVTGATGFIGRRLVYRLINDAGVQVRVMLRPGTDVSRLPRPLSIHTMVGDVTDADSFLAALDGVHTVIHLVSTEHRGRHSRLQDIDIPGGRALAEAAQTARVGRIIYVSRVGADRSSAFPILRAKGEVEEAIRASGVAYTIFRLNAVFGKDDHFSENIAMLAGTMPFYAVPGTGEMAFQPLWVEDLVTCLIMSLDDVDLVDTIMPLGGPELLSYRRIIMRIMYAIGNTHPLVELPLLVNSAGAWFLDGLFARWPINDYWIQLLSSNQTAELGLIERHFGFRPASLDIGLIDHYLRDENHLGRLIRYLFTEKWE